MSTLRRLCGAICHGRKDRRFGKFKNVPLCARCLSFYSFFFVFLALGFLMKIRVENPLVFLIIINAPMAVDGFLQLFGLHKSNNFLRGLTGAMGGSGAAITLVSLIG